MEWFKNFLQTNPVLAMLLPTSISTITFLGHLIAALSDGVIDATEYAQLMASANGIEMLALVLITVALKKREEKIKAEKEALILQESKKKKS